MPLPIPDILQNAANVLKAAKGMGYAPTEEQVKELHHLSKMVSADDLMAVMNEIGNLYLAMKNVQVLNIGSRANLQNKSLEFAMQLNYGIGPHDVIIGLPIDTAKKIVKNFNDNLSLLSGSSASALITDVGQV